MEIRVHVGLAAVGLVLYTRSPAESTDSQSEVLGQETEFIELSRLMPTLDQALVPGLVDTRALPDWLPATHKLADGHEIA